MAEALVLRVAKLLHDFPMDGQLWGPGGGFELKKTVSFLQRIVPDAERRRFREPAIGEWLGGLKTALYDAEDLLEEWNIEFTRREPPSEDEKLKQQVIISSSPLNQLDLRWKTNARKIRERIEAIAAEGRDLDLRERDEYVRVERGSRNREQSDSFVYDEEIIGRESDKSTIKNFLLDYTDKKISFLVILGEPGIGKTALARCLYEDDMVKKHFDLRIWVSWGSLFDPDWILQQIIESVTTERVEMEQLGYKLEEHIHGKKFLLVIDDLWNAAIGLESLIRLFNRGAQGSKILITESNPSAAFFMGAYHSVCALQTDPSFDLLMRMACQEEEETRNPIKVDIGKQIVKKCPGFPLAIRIIGSLLFFKKTEAEWSNFVHEIPESSAHFLDSILELSYMYLPFHLKQCLAFCSLFPRYWVIDKVMLTSLWIAEGFIQPVDSIDRDMEDIAHDYFMDLLRRNFFQDCTKDELGNVKSCRMHVLVYSLACRVTKEEYFLVSRSSWSSLDERTRHLSWDSDVSLQLNLNVLRRAKCLRTFIKISHIRIRRLATQTSEEILHAFISDFKPSLRVLDWHDSGIVELPSSICKLRFLTFLDLSENEGIIRLPDSITRLQPLQVLKLNMCYKLRELPNDIRRLVNLRQLEISNCNALSYMPQGMGELTLLHTLTDFILPGDDAYPKNYGGLGELNRLNNLRGSLRIEVKGEIKDAVAESNDADLEAKNSLVSLVLVCAGKESDKVLLEKLRPSLNLRSLEIRGYGGTGFPSWISFMPMLVELRLFHCEACKSLPPLDGLPSLMRFEIGVLPVVKCTESDLHALLSLPNLSALGIRECPNLRWIALLLDLKKLGLLSFPLESLQTSVAAIEQVIGIDNQVKDVIKLLEIEDDKAVRIVIIHGTSGIGKTTIAKAVYDRLSSCFDSCSFLAEIGETIQNFGNLQFVQTKLICDILERDYDVASFKEGIEFFLGVFRNIKALIVLDDVKEKSCLDDLVGQQLDWFGSGSRIIVTTENCGILQNYDSQVVAHSYKVCEMDNYRVFELFCKHALGAHSPISYHPESRNHLIEVMGQIPLVIEVIGSFLLGKTIKDWMKMGDLIKPQTQNSQETLKDCQEILKVCYDELDEMQKQICWDIAWFANGIDSRIASYMWPDRYLLSSNHILIPLAKIGEENILRMHKLSKRLIKTIDQERQYLHVTDLEVINRKEGMEEVRAVCFDLKNLHPHTFTETDFKSMPNLRFLKLDHASMTGNFANVFPKLRWLRWQGCPRDFVAREFSLTELVILDLSWSKVTEDWGCWRLIKMEQLKVLNLTGCTDLFISPTFSSFSNLEILILERCSQLVHLDPSVGCLKKLLRLNLKSCTELNRLPDELGALKALKELLIDETSVRIIPLGSDSKEVETLSASNCMSLNLPDGVGKLVKLRHLSLRNCHWIRKLPDSIGQSPLEELDISGTGIVELPDSFANLQGLRVLKMDHCFISKFPSFIWRLRSLEEIHASSCRNIEGEIPGDIGNLENLRILRFRNSAISSLPPAIKRLSKLETLDVLDCDMLHELPALPSSLVIVHLSLELKEKVSPLGQPLLHNYVT